MAWLAILGLVGLTAGCSKPEPEAEPIRSVKVQTVTPSVLQSRLEFSGDVRARVESRLGFRVAGKMVRRQAELGQRVKVGEVLAQLDPQDFRLANDAAQAQVAAALTNRDLAAADYKRYKELRDQNFISGAELERRDTALKSAQAQYDQARAQSSSQGNQARYTRLVADVAGVVTGIEAEPGQVVAAGTPVVRIAQDGPRDVVFTVPEDMVAAMAVGSPVEARIWASDAVLSGTVREVAASADPVTRTFQVKVALETAEPPPLGTTMTVVPKALSRAGAPVIKLPTSALWQDAKQGSAVWVLEPSSMTVRAQPVAVATADGNEVVIGSGLTPGMQVVTAGVHVLAPGQKVRIYQERTTASAAAVPAPAPVAAASTPAAK
ncbi:efflux transporter periplasmic adaptor subunit [Rhodoferax koreense]|uniref:Efflux transporter periplasmic adaptor subunit n=1 Tax=Rhodoferax koreensis TaxID=1842727 RepID=A0A1P8K3L5_9BURK|nr:efflux RND transporter periplasmic adaptor subunit [Rhodoferax koreense]APW40600.1 efflux transporter periplasmic adaptor subunit [Rhodoferax koreense]